MPPAWRGRSPRSIGSDPSAHHPHTAPKRAAPLYIGRIRRSVDGLLEVAGKVGANTANIPQLEATAPVLALIVDEAVVQDGYMNALTDGYGET